MWNFCDAQVRRRWAIVGLLLAGAITLPSITMAQTAPSNIVPDATLGAERSQVIQNFSGLPIETITGGAQRGQNLFHSFSQFNVSTGRGAYFSIPNDVVRNVLTRVTGGSRSDILGTLGTYRANDGSIRVPGVNLFLINPNGIVFGANASLDIGGSFFATTANAVQLGDAGLFSASQSASSNLLNVNPSAFLFDAIANQNLPEIVVRSRATQTVLGDQVFGLLVPVRQNLLLLGGDVNVDGGSIDALGGRVELDAIAGLGIVGLNENGSLRVPDSIPRANISFSNNAEVDVRFDNGGNIGMTAKNISVSSGSALEAGIFNGFGTVGNQAGSVTLDATGELQVVGQSSRIRNNVGFNAVGKGGDVHISAGSLSITNGASISASTSGMGDAGNVVIAAIGAVSLTGGKAFSGAFDGSSGKGGDVRISANSLSATNGGTLSASTETTGNAGNVLIAATGAVSFDGTSTDGKVLSGAFSDALSHSSGKGGDVRISANSLSVTNGAALISGTLGTGDAGNVVITATGAVSFNRGAASSDAMAGSSGKGGDVHISAGSLSVTNGAFLTSSTDSTGDAGNVVIAATDAVSFIGGRASSSAFNGSSGKGGDVHVSASVLSVTSGAFLISSTAGTGDAGNVVIEARERVLFDGTTANGQLVSGAFSNAVPGSSGKGGDVRISTGSLSVTNGAFLSSSSLSTGDAGNVVIRVKGAIQLDNGTIETRSQSSSGGDIQISAERIRLFRNSDIRTFVESGGGKGGDITLNADSIIALNDSDILTFSTGGTGGNIAFNTRAFFGQNYRPAPRNTDPVKLDGNNRVDINASGTASGIITLPDVSFLQNSFTEFPQTLTDTTQLLANSCIVRRGQQNGSFTITGSGGLPQRPGNASVSPFPTGEVRTIAEVKGERREGVGASTLTQNSKLKTQNSPDRPWKIGDPIVEPQGAYQLPDGQLILSRECSN